MGAMGMNGSRNNDEGAPAEAAPQPQGGQGGYQQQNPCAQQMDEFLQVRHAALEYAVVSIHGEMDT